MILLCRVSAGSHSQLCDLGKGILLHPLVPLPLNGAYWGKMEEASTVTRKTQRTSGTSPLRPSPVHLLHANVPHIALSLQLPRSLLKGLLSEPETIRNDLWVLET